MKKVTALFATLLVTLGCLAQSGSPYSNNVFPAQSFTATAQTGAVIQLNGQQLSYGAGTISLTGTSLTTATVAVMGSSDGGVTYYALPISAVAAPGTTPTTTITATASGLYQVSLVGITHVKFVTSGTFTATSVSLVLTATPNFAISRSSSGGGGSSKPSLPLAANVIYTLNTATDQGSSTQFTDVSGNSNNATFGATGCTWTGNGCDFSVSNNSVVSLPASLNGDESYCATVYLRLYGQQGAEGDGAPNFDFLLAGNNINATGISWLVATSNQIYNQFSFNGSIQTQAADAEAGTHVICWVQGLAGNSTNDRFFTDGVENAYTQTGRSGGGQTSGNLLIGRTNFSQPGFFDGILYNFAGWAGQITPAQVLAASNVLKATAHSYGVQTEPMSELNAIISINAIGDSITDGFGASTAWPSLLSLTGGYTVYNNGFYGIEAASQVGQARWRDAPHCKGGFFKSLAIIFVGTNDVTNGLSAGQVYGYLQADANLLAAAGCQVAISTMLSRSGQDANKNLLNGYIRGNSIMGNYIVADPASVPLLGADGAYAGADFSGDGVHPNQTGQNAIAASMSNVVNAYGFGAASEAAPTVYSSNTVTMSSGDRFANIIPTAAATVTLPDCLGVTGTPYTISNLSAGANTITVSGKASEAITGSATIAQNVTAKFRSTLISPSAAGCGWLRVQ